jgi:DNA-binding IclR family transcriptional regulator
MDGRHLDGERAGARTHRRGDPMDDPFLTQVELAETLGLSSVHVNRTLQELRRQKLITLDGGLLTIQNLKALEDCPSSMPNISIARSGQRSEHALQARAERK